MKKNKILATAMTSIMMTGMLSGCTYNPEDNVQPCLYGSPPEKRPFINQKSSTFDDLDKETKLDKTLIIEAI